MKTRDYLWVEMNHGSAVSAAIAKALVQTIPTGLLSLFPEHFTKSKCQIS